MSEHAMNWAWRQPTQTVAEKLVLLCLASHYNESAAYSDPSLHTLADSCGVSRRYAISVVQSLEQQRLIRRTKREGTSTAVEFPGTGHDGRAVLDAMEPGTAHLHLPTGDRFDWHPRESLPVSDDGC